MKYLLSPLWAIITLAALTYVVVSNPIIIQNIELKISDQLMISEPIDSGSVLIDIDEKALARYGQFPFPRNEYADLIHRLRLSNAGAIVFNMAFPEEDRSGQDDMFTQYLSQGVILSHFPTEKSSSRSAYTTGIVEVGPPAKTFVPSYSGIAANLEKYETVVSGVGIANTLPESDGVVRRLPMISRVGDTLYPSLTLEILKLYTGTNTYQIKSNDFGVVAVRVKGFPIIKTDALSRVWINPNYTHTRYSMADTIPDLEGKTVFIGVTAEGIANPVPTPSGAVYGHEIASSAFASVRDDYNISTPQLGELYKILAIGALGLMIVLLSYIRFGWLVSLVAFGSVVYLPFYAFINWAELHLTILPALMSIIVFAHVYGVKFGQEFFEKMAIKKQFAGYASPTVVRMLQENPALIKEGMKKEVSICFTDLRGFTPLGESFGDDVKGLTQIMNGYMDAITQPILDADGMVIKYIGDASMHIHNAPIDDPLHPHTAVRTALDMIKAVKSFNDQDIMQDRPPVGMGAGVNTGLGYIGEMGSTARHSYDILGDAVSTAARLESACKSYGVLLIVGPETYERTKKSFFYLKLDKLAVKGKTVGLEIYTALDLSSKMFSSSVDAHAEMHVAYQEQDFEMAIHLCKMLRVSFYSQMEDYYDIWIERCRYMMKQDLPEDWDGVFIATTK